MATFEITRDPDWTDIDLSFRRDRATNDITILTGEEAIRASIINLVQLNFYEKKFAPDRGSNVRKLLFDPVNMLTANFVKQAIEEVLVNYEPRALLLNVVVTPALERNRYDVDITFRVRNRLEPVTINFFLERIR